ncbi:MAG: hypothetical protein ACXVBO_19850, partial [Isosphaeraceae bacterium]
MSCDGIGLYFNRSWTSHGIAPPPEAIPALMTLINSVAEGRVWASNAGVQPMFILMRTLAPGQSITQSATWNGQSNIGSARTATGHLVVASQVEGVQPVNIQIRQR